MILYNQGSDDLMDIATNPYLNRKFKDAEKEIKRRGYKRYGSWLKRGNMKEAGFKRLNKLYLIRVWESQSDGKYLIEFFIYRRSAHV